MGVILCMTPWDNGGDLGRAYNEAMALLPGDAWAIFKDHDACATTGLWHRQFQEAIAAQSDAGAIVAMTNRIASPWQRAPGCPVDDVMDAHREFGARRARIRTLVDVSDTKGWGGVLFAVSKRAWAEAGGFASGLGCVDHSLHFALQRVGRKVWMHEGIYAWHWRHKHEADPTSEFPKAANCPCRGRETPPSVRITLP